MKISKCLRELTWTQSVSTGEVWSVCASSSLCLAHYPWSCMLLRQQPTSGLCVQTVSVLINLSLRPWKEQSAEELLGSSFFFCFIAEGSMRGCTSLSRLNTKYDLRWAYMSLVWRLRNREIFSVTSKAQQLIAPLFNPPKNHQLWF